MIQTVLAFLRQSQYNSTAEALEKEAGIHYNPRYTSKYELKQVKNAFVETLRERAGQEYCGIPLVPEVCTLNPHRQEISSIGLHSVLPYIASGGKDGLIKIWDLDSGSYEFLLKGHSSTVSALEFSAEAVELLSSSYDATLKLWNLNTKRCFLTLVGHSDAVIAGKLLNTSVFSSSKDKTIRIWGVPEGNCLRLLNCSEWPRGLTLNSSGYIAYSQGAAIEIYSTLSAAKYSLVSHSNIVDCLAFLENPQSLISSLEIPDHVNSEYLVSGSRDCTIRVWDCLLATCLRLLPYHSNWVNSVIVEPKGNYIFSCGDDQTIFVYSIGALKLEKTILDAHKSFIRHLDYSAVTKTLISSTSCEIKIWKCC